MECMRLIIIVCVLISPCVWGADKVQIDIKEDEILYGKTFKNCNPLASGAKQKLANRFLKNQEIIKNKMSKVYKVSAKINQVIDLNIKLTDEKLRKYKVGCLSGVEYTNHLNHIKKDGRIVRSANTVHNFYSKLKLQSHNALTLLVKSCANSAGLSLYGLQVLVKKQERAISKGYFDKLLVYTKRRLKGLVTDYKRTKTCWSNFVPGKSNNRNTASVNTMERALDSFNKMNRIIKDYFDYQKRQRESRLNNLDSYY